MSHDDTRGQARIAKPWLSTYLIVAGIGTIHLVASADPTSFWSMVTGLSTALAYIIVVSTVFMIVFLFLEHFLRAADEMESSQEGGS